MKFFVLIPLFLAGAFASSQRFIRTIDPRITNGKPASQGQFPYQISYQLNGRHNCGGSILTTKWILTAGHCIPKSGDQLIVAGITNLKETGSNKQSSTIKRAIVHPDYQGGVNPNDLALVELNTPFKLTNYVKTIALPTKNAVPKGEAILSGWGSVSTNQTQIMPDALQTANLPIMTLKECGDALVKILGSSKPLADTNVCTGSTGGTQSACGGDSGGPLAQNGQVVGVVSWGIKPCGSKGHPSVYGQVSNFVDWINKYIST